MTILWIRGIVFTLVVPCVVGVLVPHLIDPGAYARSESAIFFTKPLTFLLGEEPPALVDRGLYRVSRNPMYVGVLLVVLGQAIVFASSDIALYALALWCCFHLVVVFFEEPHLRTGRGPAYDEYCRQVPRWLGRSR